MKKVYGKLFGFVIALAVISSAYYVLNRQTVGDERGSWQVLNPVQKVHPLNLLTRGAGHVYSRLSAKDQITFNIEGPVFLRIITRYHFPQQSERSASYQIHLTMDQSEHKTYSRKGRKSFISKYEKEEGTPGKIRDIHVAVPEGSHTARLTLPPDALYEVNIRVLSKKESPKGSWTYVTPISFGKPVTLSMKGKERTYFTVSETSPLVLEARGSTQLRIVTRWLNWQQKTDKGRYEVKIFENGTLKLTKLVETKPMHGLSAISESQKSTFVGDRQDIYVDVPEVKSRYQILAKNMDQTEAVMMRPFVLRLNHSKTEVQKEKIL